MAAIIQFRRDTAANWTSESPTLADGEFALESDTKKYKIGDGSTTWTSLAYGGLGSIDVGLIDAKGDLLPGSADNTVTKLSVGSNGQVLVADSSATTGLKWVTNESIVNWHEAVKLATAATLPAGALTTYSNGTAGEGATLTHTPSSTPADYVRLQIDGANATTGDRVLIQDQSSALQNGIYDVTAQGVAGTSAWVLTRADDFDGTPAGQIKQGESVYVLAGSNNAGQGFVVTTTSDPHTVGTHDITFTQFTGTQAFTAGTYLTISGNTINHDNSGASAGSYGSATQVATLTTDAQGHLTAVSNTTIAIPSTAVTDFTEAVQDVTAGQLVTNGSHSGIAATYDDAGDGAIDLNVDDFTITLAGDLSGNTTITNLANATLTATIVADATALGTDTTGNYVATVAGTANEVEVTGSGSETAAVTVGLPNDVTIGNDLTVTADVGAVNATLSGDISAVDATFTGITTLSGTVAGASPLIFEGATANDFETTLAITDPTADRTITIPNVTGTVVTTGNLSAATEHVEDTVGAQFATNGSHTGITATYDDAGDGAVDLALITENVQDITGAQLATNGSHTGIAATYDDGGDGAVDLTLTASGASAASYGSATQVPGYTVDTYGRLTAASNTTIAIPSTAVTDFSEAVQDVAGAQLATNGSHTGATATYDDAGDGAIDLKITSIHDTDGDSKVHWSADDVLHFYINGGNRHSITQTAFNTTAATWSASDCSSWAITKDDNGATATPFIYINRNSASQAANDLLGQIQFNGDDAAGSDNLYGYITGAVQDPAAGAEDGIIRLSVSVGGTGTDIVDVMESGVNLASGKGVLIAGTSILTATSLASTVVLANGVAATTQSADDNSTKVATTAYVDTGLGALSSDSITDADGDTKIQVEESSDEDIIRFDTGGTERMSIAADGTVTIVGNLTVNGTTTEISSTTITVDDKNIELGSVASPSDTTADGGGLTLKGASDKTWNWVNSTDAWTSSEHVALASGKSVYIDGVLQLSKNALAATVVLADGVIATTQSANDSSTKVATTAFVMTELADYATLASPTLTGTPAAPTAAADTNTTQIATTAYVQTELAALSSDSITDADGDTKIQVEEASDEDVIRFDTGGAQRAYIDSNGMSVGSAADISPSSGGAGQFKINGSGYGGYVAMDGTGMYFGHNSSARTLVLQTDETDRLTVTGDGNVAIGTSTATEKVSVVGNIYVQGPDGWNGAGDLAIVALGSGAANERFGVGYKYGTGMIMSIYKSGGSGSFGSTSYDAMTILDTSGKVGIGTSSPAAQLDVSGNVIYNLDRETQTGTTYTFVIGDRGKYVTMDNGSAQTVTVPPNSSVAFPVGTQIQVIGLGAGEVTMAAGSGVTLRYTPGLKLRAQYSSCTCIKIATDEWVLVGDLEA